MLSARQAQEAARKGLVTQAAADLEDTLREAIDQIRREEPEANYEWNGSVATISGPNATIEFRIQPDFRSPVDVDSVVGLV